MRVRPILIIPLLAAAVTVGSAPDARSEQVQASAQTIQVMGNGPLVYPQFRITVSNDEPAVENVDVVLGDGSVVIIGDIPAGSTAFSTPQTRAFDMSNWLTRSVPMPVLVRFTVAGVPKELKQTIVILAHPASAEGGL